MKCTSKHSNRCFFNVISSFSQYLNKGKACNWGCQKNWVHPTLFVFQIYRKRMKIFESSFAQASEQIDTINLYAKFHLKMSNRFREIQKTNSGGLTQFRNRPKRSLLVFPHLRSQMVFLNLIKQNSLSVKYLYLIHNLLVVFFTGNKMHYDLIFLISRQ